jgi:hypothetical protein
MKLNINIYPTKSACNKLTLLWFLEFLFAQGLKSNKPILII